MKSQVTVLAISNPAARYLAVLEELPGEARIVAADNPDTLRAAAGDAEVILCGATQGGLLREIWPAARSVKWVHSLAAGVDNVIFPELAASEVPLTNARGVFRRSLAEFAIAGALFFAKDLRRMIRSQEAGVWDTFDTIGELHGATLGIVGYGEIGRASAGLARAFGMRVVALRRRPELCAGDPLVDRAFAPEQLRELLSISDYVLAAAPLTAATRGLIGEDGIRAMKPDAVLINVGRGPVVDEAALIRALRERRIRGAALDVFEQEPLPAGHPFYSLDNVLLSAHSADHTPGWLESSVRCFVENFRRWVRGEPLLNVVDKRNGY